MKPILFAKDETDFTTNGLGRLDCISCKVIEERNGMFELEAEIPVSSAHAGEIEQLSIIGAKAHDGGNIQAFTVYKITKPMNGRFMVYARHLSYRLSDIPCSPFTVAASPQAAANTLAGLKNNALEPCPFNFSTDVTTGNPYTQKVPASIRQRLGGVEGSVLDQFGGEFEFDNWNVKLWKSRGRLSNVTGISLRYGKNITDINQEEEIASTVTGVVPFWIDTDGNNLVTLPEHVVYADNAANYPYHITQVLDLSSEFEEKPTVAQLRGIANAYVHKDGFGVPKVSIKVSFANLWESEEYKDIAPLERVQLCDEVSVYFEKLGISSIAKVVKTDFDVLKERYNNVEVGNLRTTLAQAVTDRDKDIDTTFIQEMTRVSTAITNATAWLTNANGYVVAVKNTDGSWKELLFMNTNDPQTATQGIRFNNNGIGFWNKATDGGNVLDGPYGTAWTIDGRLGDFADKNFWNIRTGDFSLSASATVGGQTVQQIADSAQQAAENTAAAALAAQVAIYDADITDLQNQIDGNVTTWYYSGTPTLNNLPASQWTTTTDKDNHIGDIYYDSATGYAYRFMKDGNNYIWTKISDSDIEAALAEAQDAWDLADNKRRVFITQPVPPYDLGDLWVQGSNGDIKRCATAKTSTQTYSASDWVLASKYTDDTAVTDLNNALTQLEIFNRLTNNGQTMGIYLNSQDNKLYINATYIQSGKMSASIIEGGVLLLGGYNNTNGEFEIRNASNNVIVKGNKDGLSTTELTATGNCKFGNVEIGTKAMNMYYEGQILSYLYTKGLKYIYANKWSYISKTLKTEVFVCPSRDGWSKISDYSDYIFVGVYGGGDDSGSHAGTEVFRFTLYKWENNSWTNQGYISFDINSTRLHGNSNEILNIPYTSDDIYKIKITVKYYSWASNYLAQIWTGAQETTNITPLGVTGNIKGSFEGSANFYGLSVGNMTVDPSGLIANKDNDDTNESYSVDYGGFNSQKGTNNYTKLSCDGEAVISAYKSSTEYIKLNTSNPSLKIQDSSSEYLEITKSKVACYADSSAYVEISTYPQIEVYNSSENYINISADNKEIRLEATANKYVLLRGGSDLYDKRSSSSTWSIAWTSSDKRNKDEIEDLDTELSKKLIDATEPKKFKYKDQDGKHYGMIAQDVRELLDNLGETDARLEYCVNEEDEYNPRNIIYTEYTPHLINYVKDLRAVVDRQQAEIDQLKEIVKKLSM